MAQAEIINQRRTPYYIIVLIYMKVGSIDGCENVCIQPNK